MRQMHGLGFEGKLKANLDVLDLGELRKETDGANWLDTFKYAIEETRRRLKYDLLVIDSLGALTLISEFQRPREESSALRMAALHEHHPPGDLRRCPWARSSITAGRTRTSCPTGFFT